MGNITMLQEELGIALDIHIYVFGVLFILITMLAIGIAVYMVLTRHHSKYLAFQYYLLLVLCIALLSVSRTIFMFIDPYGIHMYTNALLREVNLNLANAFLASAIFMLLIVLVRITKMKRLSGKMMGARFLVSIVIINVAVSVTSDVLVGLYTGLEVLMILCAGYFLLWGVCCCALFIYIIISFYRLIYVNRKKVNQDCANSSVITANTESPVAPCVRKTPYSSHKMPLAMKLSIIIFVLFVLHLVTLLYGILCLTVLREQDSQHGAWGWYIRNTANRAIELAFSCTILSVCVSAIRRTKADPRTRNQATIT